MELIAAIATAAGVEPLILPAGVEEAIGISEAECSQRETWGAGFLEYKGFAARPQATAFISLENPDGSGTTRPWWECSAIASTFARIAPKAPGIFHTIPIHGAYPVFSPDGPAATQRQIMAGDITSAAAQSLYQRARQTGYGNRGAIAVEIYPDEITADAGQIEDFAASILGWTIAAARIPVYATWAPVRQTPFFPPERAGQLWSEGQTLAMLRGAARAGAAGVVAWGWRSTPENGATLQRGLNDLASLMGVTPTA